MVVSFGLPSVRAELSLASASFATSTIAGVPTRPMAGEGAIATTVAASLSEARPPRV